MNMFRIQRRAAARRGGVLIATLVMVLSIGALSICLLELDSSRLKRQIASIDNKKAFNLAEAGLAEAYYSVAVGETGNVGSVTEPAKFGDGLFWVESTELEPNVIGLESTGMSGSGRVTLALVVRRKQSSVASLGVMSSQDITVGDRVLLDAYDSSSAALLDLDSMPLRSNGNIAVGAGTVIRGDATPGPDGSVSLGLLSLVIGSIAPGSAMVALPPIEVPEIEYGEDIVHSAGLPLTVSAPEVAAVVLSVASGSTVRLVGPTVVLVEQLNVEAGGVLEIDTTNGPVELHVTDWVNVKSTATLRFPAEDTTRFSMLVSARGARDRDGDGVADLAVRFQPLGEFYGTFYAPGARVALPANYELFGTISADRLVLGNGSKVHFDTALLQTEGDALDSVEMMSWRIVEIPVEVARDLAEDPFDLLAVDSNMLPAPAQAHEQADYQIHVKYLDLSLTERSYRGAEASFDWGQVRLVLNLVRALP